MFFVLIAFLIIILIGVGICVKNKKKFGSLIKNNIIKIVVILHLIYISIIFIFGHIYEIIEGEFNYATIGCLFIILFSVIIIFFNKKLSKNKILKFSTIILYIIVLLFVPVYSISGHYHEISEEENIVEENVEEENTSNSSESSVGVQPSQFTNVYAEKIISYTGYRNCYFIKIYTLYE